MRLWHYKLIPYLPNKQLLAQWRELNSIFKKQDKHILINYIYEYSKEDLQQYANMVIFEMNKRGFNITSLTNYFNYFNVNAQGDKVYLEPLFKNHHNHRYLLQCFYNLQEKYDRGQKDFSEKQYNDLYDFIEKEGE